MELVTKIKNSDVIVLNESVNRDIELAPKKGHLDYQYQAKVDLKNRKRRHQLVAGFSFFDKESNFLGLDTNSVNLDAEEISDPYYLKMCIEVPKGTSKVECELDYKPLMMDKWTAFLNIGALLILLILASFLITIWL